MKQRLNCNMRLLFTKSFITFTVICKQYNINFVRIRITLFFIKIVILLYHKYYNVLTIFVLRFHIVLKIYNTKTKGTSCRGTLKNCAKS